MFATDRLPQVYPAAQAFADKASGLLAISISKAHASYVLWFRPEVVQTVKWGGDPQKAVQEEAGSIGFIPGSSFEIWKETVRERSLPWDTSEIEAVKELRNAIVGIVLRRAEELAALSRGAAAAPTRNSRPSPIRSRTTCARRSGTSSAIPSC